MTRTSRAAQFAPFAALTGYEAAILETARLTDVRIELDESRKVLLDEKLQFLSTHLHDQPEVTITFFEPDEKKDGGAYRTVTGAVQGIADQRIVVGETAVPLADVIGLILEGYED